MSEGRKTRKTDGPALRPEAGVRGQGMKRRPEVGQTGTGSPQEPPGSTAVPQGLVQVLTSNPKG